MSRNMGSAAVELLLGAEAADKCDEDRVRREEEAAALVRDCYHVVLHILGHVHGLNDAAVAVRASLLFESVARAGRKVLAPAKGRGKAKADPDRTARLLAAYRAVPEGRKEGAVAAAAGAVSLRDIETAMKLVQREIQRQEREAEALVEAFARALAGTAAEPLMPQILDGMKSNIKQGKPAL